jgi:hypothetical protein
MHASEESDTGIVSTKRRTKAVEASLAEVAERRPVTKENHHGITHTTDTERSKGVTGNPWCARTSEE